MTNETNQPVHKVRVGNVTATVWAKPNPTGKGTFHNVQVEKNYKTKEDEWKTTNNYNRDDLPKVRLATTLVYQWLFSEDAKDTTE